MVLWGGLLPIPHQVVADVITCLGWIYAVGTAPTLQNFQLLLATCGMTVAVSGNGTNKWTMIFPMYPLILLQLLRRIFVPNSTTNAATGTAPTTTTTSTITVAATKSKNKVRIWISRLITGLSILLILVAAALSILFPALQLPLPVVGRGVQGQEKEEAPRYHVGVVDLFLPVHQLFFDQYHETGTRGAFHQDHVTVRILYPTENHHHHHHHHHRHHHSGSNNDDKKKRPSRSSASSYYHPKPVPFLKPETATDFCQQTMKYGSPPPLKTLDWMLHNWRLGTLGPTVYQNAPLLQVNRDEEEEKEEEEKDSSSSSSSSSSSGWPIVVYSHGLGGTAELYSYQTVALASAGFVVLVVEHADGSAAVISRPDGSKLVRNTTVEQVR
jgi:hypothetical protein